MTVTVAFQLGQVHGFWLTTKKAHGLRYWTTYVGHMLSTNMKVVGVLFLAE